MNFLHDILSIHIMANSINTKFSSEKVLRYYF